ncbi:MAG: cytochrome c [Pseudomonadota bacterium]|nr:cytochrome c [Pseudomonadota bacterium]MDP1903435.1 cytochrome c [Pseudomonadota bacterium]MDP2352272.1 cytochrome c [Pseudomonadota bacterium]
MKTLFALLAMISISASAAPFDKGDAKAGKALHDKQCNACHAARFSGDANKIYTRADRRVKNTSGLAQMITACNANLGNNLFPEDELNLAAHLNTTFYKFK